MSPSLAHALMLRKSDQALCAAVRDGHDAAFAAIVTRHRSQLLRQCRSLLRDGHAEDAVQQTFVRALQALRSGTEVRELGPWLQRIARNVALTELSARHRAHVELSEDWEDQRHAGEFDRRAELRAALGAVDALPDRQRAALLRSIAGETPAVIAQQLGMSNVALRQLLHRARVSVRAAVNALLPPPLLLWLSRRAATVSQRVPRAAGVPATAAPLATKIVVAVVATATVATPVTVIHRLLAHHPRPAHHHHRPVASLPAPVPSSPAPRTVIMAPQPSPALTRSAPVARHAHHSAVDVQRPRPVVHRSPATPAPTAAPTYTSSQSSQEVGISASSPDSAPVGAGSSSGSAGSAGPTADATTASSSGGSSGSSSGPVATASASGPTTASGSGSGP